MKNKKEMQLKKRGKGKVCLMAVAAVLSIVLTSMSAGFDTAAEAIEIESELEESGVAETLFADDQELSAENFEEVEKESIVEESIGEEAMAEGDMLEADSIESTKYVSDWNSFRAAIADQSVSEIIFTNDISRPGTSAQYNLDSIHRSLKIDGNGKKLTIGSGNVKELNSIQLGDVESGHEVPVLELVDLVYLKSAAPTYALIHQTGSTEWDVKIHNVKSDENASTNGMTGLINASRANVELSGTIYIKKVYTSPTIDMVKAKSIVLKEGTSFEGIDSRAVDGNILVSAEHVIFENNVEFKATELGEGSIIVTDQLIFGENVKFAATESGNGDILRIACDFILDNSVEWNVTQNDSGNVINAGGQVVIKGLSSDGMINAGNGSIVKAEEILIPAGTELDGIYSSGAGSIFEADKMIIGIGARVNTCYTSPASSPVSYKVKELLIEENAVLISDTDGAAYGIKTENFVMKPGAYVALTAQGASMTALNVINDGNINIDSARLYIKNNGTVKTDKVTSSCGIYGSFSDVVFSNAGVNIDAQGPAFYTDSSSKVYIIEGSQADIYSEYSTGFGMFQDTSLGASKNLENHLYIIGEGTYLDIFSGDKSSGTKGAAMYVEGKGSTVEVLDGALFNVRADNGGVKDYNSALQIEGAGAQLIVHNKSVVNLSTAASNLAANPVLRFRMEGGMTLDIEDSEVYITSEGGTSSGIRLYGGENIINVRKGGYLYIDSKGDGSSNNTSSRGIHYAGGGGTVNGIYIEGENDEGKGSAVEIIADSGPAIYSNNSVKMEIQALEGTIFEAYGNTSGSSYGAINCNGILNFTIDEPEHFDIKNRNFKYPAITDSGANASFAATNTTFALWEAKVDWNQNPTLTLNRITHMNLSGTNFKNIISVDPRVSDIFNSKTYANMKNYNRISSNNARPAIDELRISTDADQRIFGHALVQEGRGNGQRDAWTNEVYVIAEVLDSNGQSVHGPLKGTTSGLSETEEGIAPFGMGDKRGGIFEILLPEEAYLEAGHTVNIIVAWRGNDADSLEDAKKDDQNIMSTPKDLPEEGTVVQHVVPPTALELTDLNENILLKDEQGNPRAAVTTNMKTIKGVSEDKGAIIYIYLNNELISDGNDTVNQDGSWEVKLDRELILEEGDIISIALNDKQPADGLEEIDYNFLLGATLINEGNENPNQLLRFHDKDFQKRLDLEVVYFGELYLEVPEKLSFGKKVISPVEKRYKAELLGEEFGVVDTRNEKNSWQLYVRVDKEMTLQENPHVTMPGALVYQYNGTDIELQLGENSLVYQGQNEHSQDFYDIYSESWCADESDGLYLKVKPAAGRKGTYEGVLTWTLMDVPEM